MSAETEALVRKLADRQDILDCLTRMCRGSDRFDRALFLSAFHADAVIAAGPFVGDPVELYDWSSDMQERGHSTTVHGLLNHSCELVGDEAHAETYYLYVGVNRDETNILAGGRYVDRFERRDGDWRIARHNTLIEWSSLVPALANPLTAVADIMKNGPATRGPDDISYIRPLTNRRERHVPPG